MFKKIKNSYVLKYTILVLICIVITSAIEIIALAICELVGFELQSLNLFSFMLIVILFSIICGTIIAYFASKKIAKNQVAINKVISEVVSGNFDVELPKSRGSSQILVDDINKMIKELKNVKILKSDFISNFSHEFKTPIVSIKGFSEILLNEDLPVEKQKEFLQIIYDESERLSKLSKNLLLLSNLESSAIVPEKTTYFLNEQISACIKLLGQNLKQKNINTNLNLEKIKINANMDMFSQVWINLISNAIKYSKQNGIIEINLTKKNNKILISIKDNGIGIKQENIEHIFDKFYQVDNSRSENGNGLGLSIAKQIINLHDGTIQVNSTPDKFTEFIITLPISYVKTNKNNKS